MDRAFALKGKSAAYALYALTRLRALREQLASALGCSAEELQAQAQDSWAPILSRAAQQAAQAAQAVQAAQAAAGSPPAQLLPQDRALALAILSFGEALAASERSLSPHFVAEQALALSGAFHALYACPERLLPEGGGQAGAADWRAALPRLQLCAAAEAGLRTSLGLCGVHEVERM
jgi:arginyl-tRNA synthetase